MIEITSKQIDYVNSVLSGIKGAPEKAFHNVINRGLDTIRVETGRQVRSVYSITQANIRAQSNIYLRRATRSSLAGEIVFSGHKIPLYRFNASPKEPGTGQTVRAGQKKGTATPFIHAFIARMKSGHIGIFERKVGIKSRFPINEIMGSSLAQMANNAVVLEEVENKALETIDKRIDAEVNRILKGY